MDFNNYTNPIVNCLAIIFSFFTILGIISAGFFVSLGIWKLIELLK